jgi:steroid delta-isomerase-like uncharacterized protein
MSEATNYQALVHRVIEELWNQGQLTVADELYAADYIDHDPALPNIGAGPDAVKQAVTIYRTAFPDLHLNIKDMLVDGDKIAFRWTSHGTHRGDLQGVAPTGKTATSSGITISRFAAGKIAEDWANWDTLGLLRQLGVIPE